MIEGLPLIASTALSAAGSIFEGISKYNAGSYNSMLANREAAKKSEEMKYNEQMKRRSYERLRGDNIAAAAKSGLTADSFSDAMHDSDLEFERDILSLKYNQSAEISSLRSSARMKKKEAKNALWSSFFDMGTSVLDGADKYQNLYGKK